MQDPRNLSWNQFNQARSFPLLYASTGLSTEKHFRIPDDLLVGIYLSYAFGGNFYDPGGFYIGEVVYYHTGVSLSIFYQPTEGAAGIRVAETTIDLTHNPSKIATLMSVHPNFFYGHILFGEFHGLAEQPAGEWKFTHEAAAIDPFCIRPTADGMSALYVQNGGRVSGPLYGEVTLSSGERISLEVLSGSNMLNCPEDTPVGSGTEVIISSSNEAGGPGGSASRCVQSINGVVPDEDGNIQIIGTSCLDINTSQESTLVFNDTCAQPCCTCKELEPLDARMEELRERIRLLEKQTDVLKVQQDFLSQARSWAGV